MTDLSNATPSPRGARGRGLRDLRISVTDRCNFRCGYCMPKEVFTEDHRFLPRAEILTYEEIARIARIAVHELGVTKLRLTGGEPLLRRDLPELITLLARIDGVRDLALTTNGVLLTDSARALADSGLQRVTVSLDALDPDTFKRMGGTNADPARVLEGIGAALAAGLSPLKLNCVVIRGQNDHAIADIARRFRGTPHTVRFIEYMDVGTLNGWSREQVFGADEILAEVTRATGCELIPVARHGAVAEQYRYADGSGTIGVIASVTRPFCGDCQRARLTADGRFLTCLFSASGPSLRDRLRAGADDAALATCMVDTWRVRDDRYSELRAATADTAGTAHKRRLEMYQVGG